MLFGYIVFKIKIIKLWCWNGF